MMTSLTILLHLILLHKLSCSLEYFSPTTIHELSQIARQVGSKSIRAWFLSLQLFSSLRSTSFYLFYITSWTFPWKLVIFHDLLNLQSCHRSLRSLHSTMNYYGIFDQCPTSLLWMSKIIGRVVASRHIYYLELNHLGDHSSLRTNAFTIARQLLSASITAYYVP